MDENNDAVVIHYKWALSLKKMFSQGQADCGETGKITAYGGLVTCPLCKILVEADKKAIETQPWRQGATPA